MSTDDHITHEEARQLKRQLLSILDGIDDPEESRTKLTKKAKRILQDLRKEETKSLSAWSWADVCARYRTSGLARVENLGLTLPTLEPATVESIKKEAAIRDLVIHTGRNEVMRRELFSCVLMNVLAEFEGRVAVVLEFEIKAGSSASYGRVDYLITTPTTEKHILVVEAKQNDLLQGMAQAIMQAEALMDSDSTCSEIFAASTTWAETVFIKYSRLEHRSSPDHPVGQAIQTRPILSNELNLLASLLKAVICSALKPREA